MKRNITLTKSLIVAICFTLVLSSCSSWHYKHSRVSVDRDKAISLPIATVPVELAVIPVENKITLMEKTELSANPKKADQVNNNKTSGEVKTNSTQGKSQMNIFTDHIKKIGKAFEAPKTVEKSALSGWVRIMVILFVVGFILLLIGIFLSVFIYGGFWWLFYTFGALCILAGLIVMILGLVGLI